MKRMIFAAVSAALLFGTGVAGAETLTGKVLSKDGTGNTVTIQTDGGQEVKLRTSDATIRSEGMDIGLDRLQVGDRVRVEAGAASAEAGTERVATSVEVMTVAAAAEEMRTQATDPTREPAPIGTARSVETDEPSATGEDRRLARLPDTAGPFPVIGLLGLVAVAGGVALRRTRA